MRKVVIICHEPLTPNIKKNFYIDDLIHAGIQVEYWDVSTLIHDKFTLADELSLDLVKRISSFEGFKSLLSEQEADKNIYIVELFSKKSAFLVIDYLNSLDYFYIRIDSYYGTTLPMTAARKIKLVTQKLRQGYFWERLNMFWRERVLHKPNSVIFDLFFSVKEPSKRLFKRFVPINSIDYERFLTHKPAASLVQIPPQKYAVFLDEYLPYHPDFRILVKQNYVDANKYIAQMNALFDALETRYGIDIIVAGHPKSDYPIGTFGNRKILKYLTPDLTKNAAFVILHASLSVNYAVLWNKPMVFCYTNDYLRFNQIGYLFIKFRSEVLKMPSYCLDEVNEVEIPEVDIDVYTYYKYKYLTNKSTESRYNRDIVADELLRLLKVDSNKGR